MKNENLIYWEFQVKMNEGLIDAQKKIIKLGEMGLALVDSFTDQNVKTLMGDRRGYLDLIEDGKRQCGMLEGSLRMAEIQVKLLTLLDKDNFRDINDIQKN